MFVAQLYADFSGLMDIVLGTAEVFDITLPENFNLPFLSENLSEFWRRWHITLGEWLKDYILFPIYRSNGFKKLDKWCKAKWGKKYAKKFNLPSTSHCLFHGLLSDYGMEADGITYSVLEFICGS